MTSDGAGPSGVNSGQAPASAGGRSGTRRWLRRGARGGEPLERRFWLFWAAVSVSHLGDGMTLFAVPWVASEITDSAIGVSAASGAGRAAWLLLALPVGVMIDRVNRLGLMAKANLARLLLLLLLGGVMTTELASVWALVGLAFMLGAAKVVFDTTVESVVPSLVGHGRLPRANGHLKSADIIANDFLGRPAGGVALKLGMAAPFAANAVATALSLAGLVALRRHRGAAEAEGSGPRPDGPRRGRLRADMREGAALVWRHDALRFLLIMSAIVSGFYSAMLGIQVLYMQRVLELGSLEFAAVLMVASLGALAGSQLTQVVMRALGWARTALGSLATMAVCFLLVGISSDVIAVGALYAISGAAVAVSGVSMVSVRQELSPAEALGRVNATFRTLTWGISTLGMLGGGVMVAAGEWAWGEVDAARVPYIVAALVMGLWFFHAVRRLPQVEAEAIERSGKEG